jgi:aryl-alcohol dehydrogenase-like predicted oxidoreductase
MSVERIELRPGYSIPRVIKGGWQLAGGHGSFDRNEAINDMARFVDAGMTAFDCADIYTGVESMIGEMVTQFRTERGASEARKIQIHTKLVPDFDKLDVFTPADVEAIVDRSLKRLAVEQLHLVQFYWWDVSQGDPIGVLSSLKKLQDKGKILHLGTNNWDTDNIGPFIDAGLDMVSIQVQYSLLDARAEGRFASWCAKRRVNLFCYGTLAGGFLTESWLGKPDPGYEFVNRSLIKYRLIIDEFGGWELFQELLTVLKRIADQYNVELSVIASRAMLDRPNVAAVIIGARTAKHLTKTLPIFDVSLSSQDYADLDAVLARRTGPNGNIYALEGDKTGRHGRIMKYNLNSDDA